MRKVYFDTTQADMCIGVCVNDAEVVLAGTPVNVMSVRHKNSEYLRFAEEYDIQFIFADNVPKVDFYSVPMVDIFAIDSVGGYIGSVGQSTDLEADIPVCYVDAEKRCYLIATNGRDFLSNVHQWKDKLTPCTSIELFDSFEMAQKKYEFLDRVAIEQELRNIDSGRYGMNEKENVTEQLQTLISEYDFNIGTLSKYLGLSPETIKDLSQGNVDILPDEPFYRFNIFNKISFLYFSAIEDKDLKLSAFLEVLISHHRLSKKTIAKMAGVETSDIENLISYPPKAVTDEIKYKVAVTVMSLRFFLKECEPT